jgi:hypothetical protein
MYRADVTRIEELNRQLDELRDHAAQQSRRIETLATELRAYQTYDGHARRSAAAGVVIGVAPFMVIAAGLVVCGRGALAADREQPLTCESHVAEAGSDVARRAGLVSLPTEGIPLGFLSSPIPALVPVEGYAAALESGYITLVCNPYCDDVADNGRSLGPSPIVHVEVRPGRHVLSLLRRGFGTKTIVLTVAPGKVSRTRVAMTDL